VRLLYNIIYRVEQTGYNPYPANLAREAIYTTNQYT